MSIPIDFILEPFATSITLDACATLFGQSFTLDASAVADLYVDVSLFRSAFQFQTDASDVIDASSSDIKFFVDRRTFWSYDVSYGVDINPADAILSLNPILSAPDNKMMVCHDFTRHLALKLFNTAHGVDLFDNELDVLTDIRSKARKAWYQIDSVLARYDVSLYTYGNANDYNNSNTNANLTTSIFVPVEVPPLVDPFPDRKKSTGLYGNKYYSIYDASNVATTNPCKLLFDQISAKQPARFLDISNNADIQPLPFKEGDTISFKLIINPHTDQHSLTGTTQIPARSYKIKYVLTGNNLHSLTVQRDLTTENDSYSYFIGQSGSLFPVEIKDNDP